jgi:OOP family OmpA-OmpF porin
MKKQILITLVAMLPFTLWAQEPAGNLVNNYSFEKVEGKIKELGALDELEDWFSTTGKKADVFSKEVKSETVGAPDNVYGREKPIDGNNYAGALFYAYKDAMSRSYVSATFKKPLEAGKKYCIQFNVSLSEYSKYAASNIGAVISKDNLQQDEEGILSAKPNILHSKNKVYTEQYTWEPVCGVYEAAGGEEFMTIGNFIGTKETKYKKMKKPKGFLGQQSNIAYYFIENVTIVPFSSIDDCKCEKEEFVDEMNVLYSRKVSGNENAGVTNLIENTKIYFGDRNIDLESSSIVSLESLVKLLNDNAELSIQVLGHSDNKEAKLSETIIAYQSLSGDRAATVKDYLIEKGIAEHRIAVGDMKNMDPVNMGVSDIEISKNRRVEFVVTQ